MSRRYDRNGYTNVPEEDEYSLEAILAEYGRGGRQPAQTEEAPAPVTEEAADSAAETPAPVAEEAPDPVTGETPAPEEAADTPEHGPYRPDAPDRMALKGIMSPTAAAVLEDGADGGLAQPVSLGDRLAALAQRWRERRDGQKRRPRFQDTEQLFDQPEDEAEEEKPLEPEPLAEDLLRDEKRRCRRLRRGLLTAPLPAASLPAAAAVEGKSVHPGKYL